MQMNDVFAVIFILLCMPSELWPIKWFLNSNVSSELFYWIWKVFSALPADIDIEKISKQSHRRDSAMPLAKFRAIKNPKNSMEKN